MNIVDDARASSAPSAEHRTVTTGPIAGSSKHYAEVPGAPGLTVPLRA